MILGTIYDSLFSLAGLLEMIRNPFSTLFGKIFGDEGYISKALVEKLLNERGITLVTRLKKHMHKNLPMPAEEAVFL